uniref:Ig-like domain-containing protein n=1 Tax=Salarias fasciatus TaxID=181472 RepID=A0A672H6K1_SALFA
MFSSSPECKGEDKVMQPSGDVPAAEGDSVTLNCTFETSNPNPTLIWYKQSVNSYPEYILKLVSKKVFHAEDFPTSRFDAELKDKSVPLKIQKLDLSDSAVYYCALQPTSCCFPSLCFCLSLEVSLRTSHSTCCLQKMSH